MSLVQNERTKLLATALNNVSVATIVTGIIAPIVGFAGLHVAAHAVLGRLKQ
jgi:hypothetical protein